MRRFIRIVFTIATVISVIVYLLACCTPYISPLTFWPLTFLALAYPLIVIGIVLLLIIWLFINKRVSLVLLIILLVGYKNLFATFAFNIPEKINYEKDTSNLRILNWNVKYFDNNARHADSPTAVRRQMLNFIKEVNADIVLLQDYIDYDGRPLLSNTRTMRDSLGYKYYYLTNDVIARYSYGTSYTGIAIFSKLPLVDTGRIRFTMYDESAAHADVMFKGKRIRVFTTHLASMGIRNTRKYIVDREKQDSALVVTKNVSRTLKSFGQLHVMQAEQLKEEVARSPYPVIITGDFNSVPSSYVYHAIKGDLKDVFIKKGFGINRTYVSLTRTLRIDYILIDRSFKVVQFNSPHLYLSDHFPVVADIQLK